MVVLPFTVIVLLVADPPNVRLWNWPLELLIVCAVAVPDITIAPGEVPVAMLLLVIFPFTVRPSVLTSNVPLKIFKSVIVGDVPARVTVPDGLFTVRL